MSSILRFVFCVFVLITAGCGSTKQTSPVATLKGTITIKGQPLPDDAAGKLVFMPRAKGEAPPAEAEIKAGHYETSSAPLGDVTVMFYINRATGKMIADSPRDAHPHPELINLVPESKRGGVPIKVSGDNPNQNFDL